MSVKIRLALTGKKHQISYRLVAQDIRSKRDGKFLEILGHFNPSEKDKKRIFINKEKVKFWLAKGATFSQSAKHLFEKGELPPKPKKKVEPKKETAPKQDETKEGVEKPETETLQQEPAAEQTTATAEPNAPKDTTDSNSEPSPTTPEDNKQEDAQAEEK